MAFQILNENTVVDYLRGRPAFETIFPRGARLVAKEIGDGNLNLVFIVSNQDDARESVVVKQAVPYLRVAGESWPLTLERMRFETQALLLYNQLTPSLAPQIYDHDAEMSLIAMENLNQHLIMRKWLVARRPLPHFADHISTFIARTLFFTSDLYLTGVEKKNLQAQYINPHLCKIQEDFVFSNPYMASPENKWNSLIDAEVEAVRANGGLKIAIAEMKETYMTHAQALIHSDLHTGSIMVNENETRVIDPEFAFFGPMGYDIGAVLENLVLNYLSHYAHTPEPHARAEYQAYLLELLRGTWNGFAHKFENLWIENNCGDLPPAKYWSFPGGQDAFAEFRRRYILNLLHDTAGHGGCKMLRRMMGIVSVWEIASIQDPEKRAFAERLAIRIGSRWVMERNQMNTVEDLIGIVLEETARVTL